WHADAGRFDSRPQVMFCKRQRKAMPIMGMVSDWHADAGRFDSRSQVMVCKRYSRRMKKIENLLPPRKCPKILKLYLECNTDRAQCSCVSNFILTLAGS
ncbi:hypothetical protein PENTCL1PPCAC_24356, partial [Pristionchus entomophagus]